MDCFDAREVRVTKQVSRPNICSKQFHLLSSVIYETFLHETDCGKRTLNGTAIVEFFQLFDDFRFDRLDVFNSSAFETRFGGIGQQWDDCQLAEHIETVNDFLEARPKDTFQ